MLTGGSSSGYEFDITGTGSREIEIKFVDSGIYVYNLKCISNSSGDNYTYDQQIYTIKLYVRLQDLKVTTNILNGNNEKAEKAEFTHSYDNPELLERNIFYKNDDGSDLEIVDPVYPKTYTEGVGVFELPTDPPVGWMPGYDLYGFYDCPLDENKKTPIGMFGYEGEESIDFDFGTKITSISKEQRGDVTLYLRPWSQMVDQDLNGWENYLYAPYGVFPNGSTATIRILDPESDEYKSVIPEIEQKGKIKLVEFDVFDAYGNKIQPNSLFGSVVIGFRVPESFDVDDISVWRVIMNGTDIKLKDRLWNDPYNSALWYIEGYTYHLSPYAIISPEMTWWEQIVDTIKTGDTSWIWITGLTVVLTISAGILIWIRKTKFKRLNRR